MTSRVFIGVDNLLRTGTMVSASAAPGMPASNITTNQGSPDAAWQSPAGVVTAAGGAAFGCTFAASASLIRAVGIFRTNLTPNASVTFSLINLPSTTVWSLTLAGPVKRFGQLVAVLPADTAADYFQVTIDDSGNPDGFVNVPLAFAGPAINLGVGFSWASTFGREDSTQERTSQGGQEFPEPQYQRRVFSAGFQGITESEQWASVDYLDYACRDGRNILVIPNADSAYLQREALFGRLKPTAPIGFPEASPDARAWAATVTERL